MIDLVAPASPVSLIFVQSFSVKSAALGQDFLAYLYRLLLKFEDVSWIVVQILEGRETMVDDTFTLNE